MRALAAGSANLIVLSLLFFMVWTSAAGSGRRTAWKRGVTLVGLYLIAPVVLGVSFAFTASALGFGDQGVIVGIALGVGIALASAFYLQIRWAREEASAVSPPRIER